MPDLTATLTFAALSAAIIAVPGPSVLFIVGRALTIGRRGALLTVVGNAGGAFAQGTLVAVGLGAVVARSLAVLTAVRLVGAVYLVWLGVQAIRHRAASPAPADEGGREVGGEATATPGALGGGPVPPTTPQRPLAGSDRRVLREGFVVGVTNPKLIVFLVAFLPQFVDPVRGSVPVQMAVLCVVFVVIALALDSVWAVAAGTARDWLGTRPRRLEGVRVAGGLAMVGLGVHVAVTGRPE